MRVHVLVVVAVVSTMLLSACAVSPARPTATAVASGVANGSSLDAGLVVSSKCPLTLGNVRQSAVQGASVLLLPFVPKRVRLCRYGGLNSGHDRRLVASRELTSGGEVVTLTAAINGQSSRHLRSASCPADFGTITTLYAQDARTLRWLTLQIARSGCRTLSNGSIKNALESDRVERILKKVVGAPGT